MLSGWTNVIARIIVSMVNRKVLSLNSSGLLFENDGTDEFSENICATYDDVLDLDAAGTIHENLVEVEPSWRLPWRFNYYSAQDTTIHPAERQLRPHWHFLCGRTKEQIIENGFSYVLPIWEAMPPSIKDNLHWRRVYMNGHTFGIEPQAHTDDGDYTMIYYPILDWRPEWLGGTALWNKEKTEIIKYGNYVGNRVIVFPAKNCHQAMPVARDCYELRIVIVFKLSYKNA